MKRHCLVYRTEEERMDVLDFLYKIGVSKILIGSDEYIVATGDSYVVYNGDSPDWLSVQKFDSIGIFTDLTEEEVFEEFPEIVPTMDWGKR